MFDTTFIADDGTEYTLTVDYVYIYHPIILAADPNDSCVDESELNMAICFMDPEPSQLHREEIFDSWDSREEGSLYKRAETLALKDYFEGIQ